jgi:sulfur carrier protein
VISLRVNGDSRQFAGQLTVRELLEQLSVSAPAIAVEVNREIVPRSRYQTHELKHGDQVEIVTFVGGG